MPPVGPEEMPREQGPLVVVVAAVADMFLDLPAQALAASELLM
jgi:hypothetical protein